MKKILSIVLFSILISLISCTPDIAEPDHPDQLRLVSNVDKIKESDNTAANSRSLEDRIGEPIIGVLLKFTDEGAWNEDIRPVDKETFSLYCIFTTRENGDGMKYNYVLYVPECIKTEYQAVTGDYRHSGNPFWWYMRNYLDLSYTEIKNDWYSALSLLLESDNLPYPDRNDFTEENTDEDGNFLKPVKNLFIRSENGMDYELGVRQTSPSPMRKLKDHRMTATAEEQKDFILVKYSDNYDEEGSHTIFYPDEIEEAYKKENPDYDGESGDPFWSYIRKYYGLWLDNTATVILKAISTGEYKHPEL